METFNFQIGNTLFHRQKQNVSKSETPMKQSRLSVGDDTGMSRRDVRNDPKFADHV